MKLLLKNKKYVVACSFGPDSMALLNMLLEEKYDVVVAHVNYHKRDVSNFEEQSLRKYCEEHEIKIEVLDTNSLKQTGNFQDWARNVRYDFFKDVARKHNAEAVLVAHQQDDLLETFLMQKNRGSIVKYWGIAEKTSIKGIEIVRPLLAYSKAELLAYDNENNVPYSIDESNLRDDYTRNKIRHEVVEKLSKKEREELLNEINLLNLDDQGSHQTIWNAKEFLSLTDQELVFAISEYLEGKEKHKDLSKSFLNEMRKAFTSKKQFIQIQLIDSISIIKDYGEIVMVDERDIPDYNFVVEEGVEINNNLFDILFYKGESDRNVISGDFPLIIKPVSSNESYKIKGYNSKVNRLFIDWKLPHRYRECWPGIYNKDGKLIYIPRYRKEFVDKHSSKFVIKFVQ